jgi:hypothetical protein
LGRRDRDSISNEPEPTHNHPARIFVTHELRGLPGHCGEYSLRHGSPIRLFFGEANSPRGFA